MSNKKIAIIVIFSFLGLIILGAIILFGVLYKTGQLLNSDSTTNTNLNTNTTTNDNRNDISLSNVLTNQDATYTGRVFVRGLDTPSLSYGLITDDNIEIGLGAYDTMKEQLRPYISEEVTATFSNICKSATGDCCRSLFYYCGTVKSWEPAATQ